MHFIRTQTCDHIVFSERQSAAGVTNDNGLMLGERIICKTVEMEFLEAHSSLHILPRKIFISGPRIYLWPCWGIPLG